MVLVDDHVLVRQTLRHLLEMEEDIVVVGEAGRGEDVLDLLEAEETHPDVVILDARMPDQGGVETAKAIRDAHGEVEVMFLSAYEDPKLVVDAFRVGAHGYLLKNKDAAYLVDTIRLVVEGRIVIDPDLGPALAEGLGPASAGRAPDAITTRETEVLQLLAFGNTNKQIAEHLGISPDTVKAHLEHVFAKLGVADRAEAVAVAIRHGLVT